MRLDHYEIIQHLADEQRANDFHADRAQQSDWDYKDAAEKKINAMTNVELLELLASAIERQNP